MEKGGKDDPPRNMNPMHMYIYIIHINTFQTGKNIGQQSMQEDARVIARSMVGNAT